MTILTFENGELMSTNFKSREWLNNDGTMDVDDTFDSCVTGYAVSAARDMVKSCRNRMDRFEMQDTFTFHPSRKRIVKQVFSYDNKDERKAFRLMYEKELRDMGKLKIYTVLDNGETKPYVNLADIARRYSRSRTFIKECLEKGAEIRPGVTVDEAC